MSGKNYFSQPTQLLFLILALDKTFTPVLAEIRCTYENEWTEESGDCSDLPLWLIIGAGVFGIIFSTAVITGLCYCTGICCFRGRSDKFFKSNNGNGSDISGTDVQGQHIVSVQEQYPVAHLNTQLYGPQPAYYNPAGPAQQSSGFIQPNPDLL